jgi:basic membrane protein A
MRGKRALAALLAAGLTAVGLVFGASGGSAAPEQAIQVAIVTDIGGLNDKGFNSLSNVGLQRAKQRLNVDGRVFITQTAADRTPNLTTAAQGPYGLIIGVGFLMFEPLGKVAPTFENKKFAGVDVPSALVEGKPKNVRGLIFREAEAGCLVGHIAALEARRLPGRDIISAVGANKVPAIVAFIAGYNHCAKRTNRSVRVLGSGEVPGDGAQPDRTRVEDRLPGRGSVRPRSARCSEEQTSLGHRRGQRPVLPR